MTCLRAWAKDVPHSRVVLRILHSFTAAPGGAHTTSDMNKRKARRVQNAQFFFSDFASSNFLS